jgi:hypothetical protein
VAVGAAPDRRRRISHRPAYLPEDTDPCERRFLNSATIDSCRASAQEENAPVPPGLERSRVEDVSPGFKYLLKKRMPRSNLK